MMKINKNTLIPKLIIVIPLLLVLLASFFITTFYLDKVSSYFKQAKERSINEYITTKKSESEVWVNQLSLLLEFKNNNIQKDIKKSLKTRVDIAYESAKYIYEKYDGVKSTLDIKERIKDALSQMSFSAGSNYIFITNYNGFSLLSNRADFQNKNISAYSDADGRAIILEEITKVKRDKEGFIRTRFTKGTGVQTLMVKDLGFYDWYIGSSIHESQQREIYKNTVLQMIQSVPMKQSDFMAIYDAKKPIYLSLKMRDVLGSNSLKIIKDNLNSEPHWHKNKLDGYFYYSKYFAPFDWHIVYGFNIFAMSKKEIMKQKELTLLLDSEMDFIIKMSAFIVLLVAILSIMLSRSINQIFKRYQDEVRMKQNDLEILNTSLEQRVTKELANLRAKDKMLIQQSKMADMGDMLSMIAHQWRQPLNQLSYIFMNIDSAYEYKELTKKYLDDKTKEGNKLLEFMSETIDDFRNYFKPDQKKELVNVGDVIERGLELMRKPLESSGIDIIHINSCKAQKEIYTNEFVQVILNLVKNAKDVLVERNIQNPKIEIISTCKDSLVIVEVKDNAGGIEQKIIDKIFEPYFTTKDEQHGTGLGLYMSKMIIEEHIGGKLSVSSTPQGACFKIRF